MVEGARPSWVAIERKLHPAAKLRDISSRSATVNASGRRQRSRGVIPP